jgi:ribulose bisphosphate carboxylase small subunit
MENVLTSGAYYKIQLAYVDTYKGETGYFSTVGIVKYTTEPEVIIEDLELS